MASIAEGIVSPSDLLNSASSSIPELIGEIQQLNGHSLIASSINEAESGANPDDPPINVAGHEHVDVNDETQQGVVQPDGDEEDDEDEEVDANGAVDPGVSMRVKVYVLRGGEWQDEGTGFVEGRYDADLDASLLIVTKELPEPEEPDENSAEEAKEPGGFLTEAEEEQIPDILLRSPILLNEDVYNKQQDTLIVWTDRDNLDRALSFQDARGCDNIWDFIEQVRRLSQPSFEDEVMQQSGSSSPAPMSPSMTGDSMGQGHNDGQGRGWPVLTMANILEQEVMIRQSLRGLIGKEKIVHMVIGDDYVRQMISVFDQAEDLESLEDLHALCSMMQAILSINDNGLLDYLIQDDVFMGIMGILEYDPDYPTYKATYRDFLKDGSRIKDVPLFPNEAVKAKIHQTYRLLFLKDVILAKLLDDGIVPALSAAIFFNQVDIIQFMSNNDNVLEKLIKQYVKKSGRPSAEEGRNTFLFLHQLMLMGKNVQIQHRCRLYALMVSKGLLSACEWAFEQTIPDLSNAAAEMVFLSLDHDINGVRLHILKTAEQGGKNLIDILSSILITSTEWGLKSQASDAIRNLLEINADGPEGGVIPRPPKDAQLAEKFCNYFYEKCVETLFKPLIAVPEYKQILKTKSLPLSSQDAILLQYLTELLSNFVAQHGHRSQYFILAHPVAGKVASLIYTKHKAARHASVRFFRSCLKSNNHFLHRHIAKYDLLQPLLDLITQEAPRDNMLSSACLDVFELIRQDNMKSVINYLFEKHDGRILALSEIPSLRKVMVDLRIRWEQNNEPPPAEDSQPSEILGESSRIEMDDDDDYFNASDDEEAIGPTPPVSLLGGMKRKRKPNTDDVYDPPPPGGRSQPVGGGTGILGLAYNDDSDEEPVSEALSSPNKRKKLSAAFSSSKEDVKSLVGSPADLDVDVDDLPPVTKKDEDEEEDGMSNLIKGSGRNRPGTPRQGKPQHPDEGGGGGAGGGPSRLGSMMEKAGKKIKLSIGSFGGRKLSFEDGAKKEAKK